VHTLVSRPIFRPAALSSWRGAYRSLALVLSYELQAERRHNYTQDWRLRDGLKPRRIVIVFLIVYRPTLRVVPGNPRLFVALSEIQNPALSSESLLLKDCGIGSGSPASIMTHDHRCAYRKTFRHDLWSCALRPPALSAMTTGSPREYRRLHGFWSESK
jgi:hypothetical protein